MRFLFTTLQWRESDFYARTSEELARRGHEVAHVTMSRRAARCMVRRGLRVYLLPELVATLPPYHLEREIHRVESAYDTPSVRDVYRTDPACVGQGEAWCVDRTLRHFLALERIFDEVAPDVVVPEVGSETMRTVAHLIGRQRDIPVFFLFYTIFPQPLRLYVNTVHAPIVAPRELRELTAAERAEVEAFIADFTARAKPTRPYRDPRVTPDVMSEFLRHFAVKLLYDRDNEYLRPRRMIVNRTRERVRAVASRRLYQPLRAERPFIYFPLHVTDDYKIKRVIPHCVDQAAIIEQIAAALPQGIDLVLKEHPMSIGRNPVGLLRRLGRHDNIRLLQPFTSSHELIRRAEAVVVISSTVGLEALLYGQRVMTLGQPFYSGYGVTVDVDSFREVTTKLAQLLEFRPSRERILRFLHAAMRSCYPSVPLLVDSSDANARALAESLETAALERSSAAPRARRAA